MAARQHDEPRILVLSEEAELRERLVASLVGHRLEVCSGGSAVALDRLEHCRTLCLFVLADGVAVSGLELLEEARRRRGDVAVLLLSSAPTIELATEAIRRGAEDLVPVPYSEEVLRKEVVRILEAADLRDRVEYLRRLIPDATAFDRIVTRSPRMNTALSRARAAARSETPVLICGETGTGKELVAQAIHANSRRANHAFVPINCAALPRDLVESELFGHRRGAFTGAQHDHAGLFLAAHGGTLFLDEISELPLEAQAKLLRVVQDGEVRSIGSLDSRHVDVRIIAASNRGLPSLREGGLRPDLFYRLSVLVIEMPPLRERQDDVALLVNYFLADLRKRGVAQLERLDAAALDLLTRYPFPGNIRELQNLVESIGATAPPTATSIRPEDVRAWLRRRGVNTGPTPATPSQQIPLKLVELEAWAIAEALRQTSGNKRLAARLLGISRDTLYRKLSLSPPSSVRYSDTTP
jgi:DNA-binding NtrC family response regulator